MIRPLDLADGELARRLLEVQHRAYAVEAELIGFDGIPPLQEDLAGLMASTELWLGRFEPPQLGGRDVPAGPEVLTPKPAAPRWRPAYM